MAKALIQVAVKAQKGDCFRTAGDVLAVGVFSNPLADSLVKALDNKLNGKISELKRLGDFEGKADTSCLLYGQGGISAKRILLVGLGKRKAFKPDVLRKAA
ncbi:MAG: M17 family peptidase N-terminal domain-containing protein, partial [Planctomycetota bacterium]